MTQTTIDELIIARANDMAAHDGDVLNQFYVMTAANQLIADLLAARDRIIAHPPADLRVAGAAHAQTNAEPAPDAVVEEPIEPAPVSVEAAPAADVSE